MFELRPYNRHNNFMTYEPFAMMDEFAKNFFSDFWGSRAPAAQFRTDIKDEGEFYTLHADMPGVEKEDISLDILGDTLTIKAERKAENEEKKENYLRRERSYGVYSRQFDITGIDAEGITAKYENGVLMLTMPKKTQTPPEGRKVEIQ